MKRLVFFISFLFFLSFNSWATNFEDLLETDIEQGKFIMYEYYPSGIATQHAIEVSVVVATNLIVDITHYAISIKVEERGTYPNLRSCTLEYEEAVSLSRALDYIISRVIEWEDVARPKTHIAFEAADELSIVFIQTRKKQKAYCSCGRIDDATVWIKKSGLEYIKRALDKSIKKLNELRAE